MFYLFQRSTRLKWKIQRKTPDYLWRLTSAPLQPLRNLQYREKDFIRDNIILGPKKRYFIIRRRPPGGGLLSNVNHVLQGVVRAQELNLLPKVDMQRYQTEYSEKNKFLDTNNSWEYFFEPLSGGRINATDYFSGTFSSGERILPGHWIGDKSFRYLFDSRKMQFLHEILKQNVKLNVQTASILGSIKEYLDWNPSETLGVFLRNEFNTSHLGNHPRQPSLDQMEKGIERKLSDFGFSRIFVASEDTHLRNHLKLRYSKFLIHDFRDIPKFKGLCRPHLPELNQASDKLVKTYSYLIQMYLFAETQSCVSSISNGSVFSLILNGNKFIEPVVYDLGQY